MSINSTESKEHPKPVHFTVDGEKCDSEEVNLSPNFIITTFAHLDATTHYLVKIHGNDRDSYQDKGAEPIELHNGDRFQVISLGATPVSDIGMSTGAQRFSDELRALGYEATSLPDAPDHLVVDYLVETGKFAGRGFKLGFVIPADFPLTCPTGPMIGAALRQPQAGGIHPTGGVHTEHASAFQSALGGEWQYWSRPFGNWHLSKKNARAYMNHIWLLMDSQ